MATKSYKADRLYPVGSGVDIQGDSVITGKLTVGDTTLGPEALHVKGTGNSEATSALRIRDSDNVLLFEVRNDGRVATGDFYLPTSVGVAGSILTSTDGTGVTGWDAATPVTIAANTTHRTGSGSDHSAVAANTAHRTSSGSDHSYINQSVTSSASPTFAGLTLSGTSITETVSASSGAVSISYSGTYTLQQITTQSSTAWMGSLIGSKRGGASGAATPAGSVYLNLYGTGHSGSGWLANDQGSLKLKQTTVATGSSCETEWIFTTCASGSITPANTLRLQGDGGVYADRLLGSTGGSDLRYNTSTKELFYDTSARKYKNNIRQANDEDISWLLDVNVRVYDRVDGSRTGEIGLIADELEKIRADYVEYADGVPESYRKSDIVPVLIAHVQRLSNRVTRLESELKAIRGRYRGEKK